MLNQQEEMEKVIEWLSDPNELGAAPARIVYTNTFKDEDGIECMIFRYKKAMIGPWLLAIASESGVFSEMKKYNQKKEIEDAKEILNFLKNYWKNEAKEEEDRREREKNLGKFLGFALLNETSFNFDQFKEKVEEEWDLSLALDESEQAKKMNGTVYTVGKHQLVISFFDSKIPNGEAEACARFNYMWKEAADVTATHKSHVLVTVLGDSDVREKGLLYTKAMTTIARFEETIGIYANGVVMQPEYFEAMSSVIKDLDLYPLFNLVWVGLSDGEDGSCGYTQGLTSFGKHELEIINTKHNLPDLKDTLMRFAEYIIQQDYILRDGDTIGFTNDQRLKVTKSEGINVIGNSLKIAY